MVVDDDKDILELLRYNFVKEGLTVITVNDSTKALQVAKAFLPDLIILDVMMPELNGMELCKTLRNHQEFCETYIFFLTAKSDYAKDALKMGGDDFIEKSIGLRLLTCRVSSVLRKHFVIRKGIEELTVGKLKIKRLSHSVMINSKEVVLSPPEFELLFFFAQNPCKSISATSITQNLWGAEVFMNESSIDNYIQNLSYKLGEDFIKLVMPNRYRFYAG
jgi:two-component system alkaline phosphatase synthesis response regulator PhoP